MAAPSEKGGRCVPTGRVKAGGHKQGPGGCVQGGLCTSGYVQGKRTGVCQEAGG